MPAISHRPNRDPGRSPTSSPAVPLTATATAVESNEIDLSWNADSSGATYTIVRGVQSEPAGDFVPLVLVVVARTAGSSWKDTGLSQDVTYSYTIGKSDGEISPTVTATTWLAAPSNLTATYVLPSTETFALSWHDNSGGFESGIEVDRQFNGGDWAVDVVLPPGTTSWTEDPSATTHEYGIYTYRVRALA